MKKLYLLFVVVVIGLILFSCGIKVPQKAPEKLRMKYTKYLEFPITTLDLKVSDLVGSLQQGMVNGLTILKEDPVKIQYATSIVYSPGTFLKDAEDTLRSELQGFGEKFEYKIDSSYFLSSIDGQIQLPSIPSERQPINIEPINIGDLTIANNLTIPVTTGRNVIELPSSLLDSLPFKEANLKNVDVQFTISGVNASDAYLLVDGTSYQISINATKNVQNLFIKKSSTVKIRFDSTNTGYAQVTLKFLNQEVDYFKDLALTSGYSIPVSHVISITSGTWKMSLGGNVTVNLSIPGFTGNINQTYTAKSGGTTIGSGSSNSSTVTIGFNNNKFTVGDGIELQGTIELLGTVSADLRSPALINITPNLTVKEIENYPLSVSVPLPNNVQSLSFTSNSGHMLLKFNGITLTNVSGTFASNNLSLSEGKEIVIPFGGISLPAQVNAQISGTVNSNEISYSLDLPEDQTITIASAQITGIDISPVVIEQQVPPEVKNFANSVKATIKVDLDYDVTNVSGVSVNITSNIFDNGNGTHSLTGTGTIKLISVDKLFDFSTFDKFTMTITPTVPSAITVTNVDIREGLKLLIQPKLVEFTVSEVNLKGQTFEQDLGQLINFGDIFKDDFAFIRNLDLDITANVSFDVTNATVPATVTLNLSGTSVEVPEGTVRNVGDIIENLIRSGSPLNLIVTVKTDAGTLTKDTLITASLNFTLPLHATTHESDVLVKSGTVDLSLLRDVKDIIDKATLKFGVYNNSTGLQAILKLGPNGEINTLLGNSAPEIEVKNENIGAISNERVPYQILIPKNSTISLNYNGVLKIAPYVAVHLKVATEVNLGN